MIIFLWGSTIKNESDLGGTKNINPESNYVRDQKGKIK